MLQYFPVGLVKPEYNVNDKRSSLCVEEVERPMYCAPFPLVPRVVSSHSTSAIVCHSASHPSLHPVPTNCLPVRCFVWPPQPPYNCIDSLWAACVRFFLYRVQSTYYTARSLSHGKVCVTRQGRCYMARSLRSLFDCGWRGSNKAGVMTTVYRHNNIDIVLDSVPFSRVSVACKYPYPVCE